VRAILKGAEPASLAQQRASNGDFEDYRKKDELRAWLAREQRGLCCYCLSRIRADLQAMKIEHWRCQSRFPERQLQYSNLLAACQGRGPRGTTPHCDTSKADRDISRNPADPLDQVDKLVRFTGGGRVTCDDATFDEEINRVLNLNAKHLVNERRDTLDLFKLTLGANPISKQKFEKLLRIWNGADTDGELRPHCQVVVYWLRKRVA
jgi:uncharacterized protein (TIGR02646 family)